MAGTIGNAGMGGGVATINNAEVYNKGACNVGCEGDVAFATLDQFTAPFASRLINKQFNEIALQDASAIASEPVTTAVIASINAIPTVTRAEPVAAFSASITSAACLSGFVAMTTASISGSSSTLAQSVRHSGMPYFSWAARAAPSLMSQTVFSTCPRVTRWSRSTGRW